MLTAKSIQSDHRWHWYCSAADCSPELWGITWRLRFVLTSWADPDWLQIKMSNTLNYNDSSYQINYLPVLYESSDISFKFLSYRNSRFMLCIITSVCSLQQTFSSLIKCRIDKHAMMTYMKKSYYFTALRWCKLLKPAWCNTGTLSSECYHESHFGRCLLSWTAPFVARLSVCLSVLFRTPKALMNYMPHYIVSTSYSAQWLSFSWSLTTITVLDLSFSVIV